MNTFFNPTDEFINKLVEVINGRFVVEIGCGQGALLKALIDKGVNAIGIDPYVDISKIEDKALSTKIMPIMLEDSIPFLGKLEVEKVFIVARPCHNGFPQEYLSRFGDSSEMIYIGYTKNLEIDFERDISLIRFIKFPKHPDCSVVAVLKEPPYDMERFKIEAQWAKVDRKIIGSQKIDKGLIKWFETLINIEARSNSRMKIDEAINKKFDKKIASSSSGDEWYDFKDCSLITDVVKKKMVELDISSYMVGGGHFSCRIEVEKNSFIKEEENGLVICQPWDRSEHRPKKYDNNFIWYGRKDYKRVVDIMAGLKWLKESFLLFENEYKKEGIELLPYCGSGIDYELEMLNKVIGK